MLMRNERKIVLLTSYTLLCLSQLFIGRWETDGTTYLRKKKTNLCARKNKSVHSSFSMYVDLLIIDVNSNDNYCYECSNFVMHVWTSSSLYRINRHRLFNLISHKLLFFNIAHRIHLKFEKNNGKSSWVVLIVIGTNTIHSWCFSFWSSFIDLNKEKNI